jgi:hypothetical protein
VVALPHVLWIGGAPGAGKSSVATRIVRRHGLRWYGADTRTWLHRDRALRAGSAAAHRWEAMSPDERQRADPADMVAMSLHAERGPMVIDDLRALPVSPLVVADGSTLPAYAVSAGIADPARAVWLMPTREFQRAALARRGVTPGAAALYLLLRDVIEREAREHDVRTVAVDGSRDLAWTAAAVEDLLADALAAGPREPTRTGRKALLREANETIAGQVRGYYARPWAVGDADRVVREFMCECGDRTCEADVAVAVGAASSGALLAPDHRAAARAAH